MISFSSISWINQPSNCRTEESQINTFHILPQKRYAVNHRQAFSYLIRSVYVTVIGGRHLLQKRPIVQDEDGRLNQSQHNSKWGLQCHLYITQPFQVACQDTMAEEVKLFRTWSSLYALRIVWALKLKGIEHETIFEDLTNKSPSLLQYNPLHGKVPVLVHNGKRVCESLVILEYVDETWKHNPLLPQDPYEKSTARFWAKFGDDKV